MSLLETQVCKEPSHTSLVSGQFPQTEVDLLHEYSLRILEDHVEQLRSYLGQPEAALDTNRIRKMLLELTADIQSRASIFESGDYRWILERLTHIYAQAFEQGDQNPLTSTAAAYAQLIETISHAYPDHDYSEAIGQLVCYMSRLFRTQENSWKAVYEHILSIPDSVEAKQSLNRAYFQEIREWAEAGVENLFSIRKDLYEKIGNLGEKIDQLDRRIAISSPPLSQNRGKGRKQNNFNIIDLTVARKKNLIASLERQREALIIEKGNEEAIVGLIESDIREFEEKLRKTRRTYIVRPVSA